MRGICKYSSCRFPHPPFELPESTTIPQADRIAKPSPEALLYRRGMVVAPRVAAAASGTAAAKASTTSGTVAAVRSRPASAGAVTVRPSVPAVNAWQRPLAGAAAGKAAPPVPGALAAPAAPAPGTPSLPLAAAPLPQLAGAELAAAPAGLDMASAFPTLAAALAVSSSEGALVPAAPVVPPPPAPAAPLEPLAASSSAAGGWDPIGGGAGWSFGSGSISAAASASGSRSTTPALGGAAAARGLSPHSAGALSPNPLLAGYGFPRAGSGSSSDPWGQVPAPASMGCVDLAAAAAGAGAEQGFHLPPSLMAGLDMGVDADLAALLGPLAADLSMDSSCGAAHLSPHQLLSPSSGALAFGNGLSLQEQQPQHGQQPPQNALLPQTKAPTAVPGSNAATGGGSTRGAHLTVILQALWHCLDFRQRVLQWPEPVYKADPVVRAVRNLFLALSTEQHQQGGAGAGVQAFAPGALSAAAAQDLQDALAGQLAAAGGLQDAGEVLLTIYERIREVGETAAAWGRMEQEIESMGVAECRCCTGYAPPVVTSLSVRTSCVCEHITDGAAATTTAATPPAVQVAAMRGIASGVDELFGLQVTEGVSCSSCGKLTHQASYLQFFLNTQVGRHIRE